MSGFGENNVISAFTEDQVERLTGLSKRRLRYWDQTDFFTPAFADENRRIAFSRIYSFKDVASLRVLAVLLNQYNVSLQHLRQVSEELSHMNEDRWLKTKLYVLKRKVHFIDPSNNTMREAVSGQYALPIPLKDVLEDTEKDVAKLRLRAEDTFGQIERNRRIAHNQWVVAGTRIPVRAILNYVEAGFTPDQIIEEYPDLTKRDIEAAIAHTGQKVA